MRGGETHGEDGVLPEQRGAGVAHLWVGYLGSEHSSTHPVRVQ